MYSKADSLYKAKDFLPAAKLYQEAAEGRNSASAYYNAACSWALVGQTAPALSCLDKSIDAGWTDLEWMKKDSDLNSLHETDEWAQSIQKLGAIVEEIERKLNKPLKKELEEIYVKDQMYRKMLDSIEQTYGLESDEIKAHWKLINDTDSVNEMRVVEIIGEYGWPGRSLVGGKANSAVWLVIQHAPLATQEKYLPLLQASVKDGESSGSNLALLEDRILMRNGKPQKYGSQVRRDRDTGEKYFYEIEDPANVNERRAEVGLGPIEDYAKRFGFEYKVPEKKAAISPNQP
ncbi:MAG: DUF6624 domain-containing protein [Bacteroidota bacterium]